MGSGSLIIGLMRAALCLCTVLNMYRLAFVEESCDYWRAPILKFK